MSVILLVRHGQASFGGSDYDVLSDLGERQSRVLGRALAARGIRPDLLVTGAMTRHRSTLEHVVDAAGWRRVEVAVDEGWNEFDHEHVIAVHRPAHPTQPARDADPAAPDPRQVFQELFVLATARWSGGENDADYAETFTAFGFRVEEAMRRTASVLGPKQTAVVFTSGGPIAQVAASILSPGPGCGPGLWHRLCITPINAAVTKVVVGASGQTLVSLNDHGHLETAEPGLITYR